jgi:hypothetical protein
MTSMTLYLILALSRTLTLFSKRTWGAKVLCFELEEILVIFYSLRYWLHRLVQKFVTPHISIISKNSWLLTRRVTTPTSL